MHPTHHVIVSTIVFGYLHIIGFPLSFVALGFIASIAVDIDHMALGRIYGTYNPVEIYNRCASREIESRFTPMGVLLRKWFDLGMFPFHNLFLNAVFLIAVLPIGLGMLLHNLLDVVDHFASHLNKIS